LADSAEHAADFAGRWVDRLENFTEGRMHALDVPERQIGASDHKYCVAWRTCFLSRHEPRPAMIGTPPSARQIPIDPAAHATDFDQRWADELDPCAAERMEVKR